ncbi:MAG: HDOD domain-containing protein [Alphaproteobacteria bacterium]|nr:MAG: HDOD domain-containing protein [Alphaproteobacteria bacterium]
MDINTLLAQPNALPSAPQAVLDLMKTFDEEDAHFDDIVECIEADPVIVAKLLRLANSPMFYRGRPVESTGEAVRLLGQTKVRSLVIGLIARDNFPALPESILNQFWSFSATCADLSRYLAGQISSDEDAAYTGGLLHMIGELVMRVGLPRQMASLDTSKSGLLSLQRGAAEVQLLGYSYAEVGAALGKQWQLPERIVRIISNHRSPNLEDMADVNAAVVHMASWRARALELEMSEDDQIRLYPVATGKALGIEPAKIVQWTPAPSR